MHMQGIGPKAALEAQGIQPVLINENVGQQYVSHTPLPVRLD